MNLTSTNHCLVSSMAILSTPTHTLWRVSTPVVSACQLGTSSLTLACWVYVHPGHPPSSPIRTLGPLIQF